MNEVTVTERQFATDYELAAGESGVDRDWYLKKYPDVVAAAVDPVEHYLRWRWQAGADPRPDFSTRGYLKANRNVEGNPLLHYLRHGGVAVPTDEGQFAADYKLAAGEGGVDRTWYLQKYPDVAQARLDPVEHYLRWGWQAGADPRPDFSTKRYLETNKQVEGSPLVHYLRNAREGGLPSAAITDWHLLWKKGLFYPKDGQAVPPDALFGSERVPKILFTGHEATRTGAPFILLRLMEAIQKITGAELYLIRERGGPLLEDYKRIAHVFVNDNGMLYLPSGPNLGRMLNSIAPPGPELAICNSADGWRLVKALREAGLPHLISLIHERVVHYGPDVWRVIHQNSARVIFPADAVKVATTAVMPEFRDAHVVPQGLLNPQCGRGDRNAARIEVRRKLGLSPGAQLVLGCGTRNMRKGVDLFVQLAARVRAQTTRDVHFVWLGGHEDASPFSKFIELDISLLSLHSVLSLVSEVTDLEPYLLAADAFALTSRDDPFPCVIHDAMACALPIVVFDRAGGAKEAISQDCGIVVPYLDIEAMARSLTAVMEEPLRYADMAKRAQARVRSVYRFSDYAERIMRVAMP